MVLGKGFGILGWLAQFAAVFFWLYSAAYDLRHVYEDASTGMTMAVISLAMATATAYCIFCQFKWVREDRRFRTWLVANADKIRNKDLVFYRSQRISPDTELVRHHLVFSVLIISFRMHTRWIIKGKEPRAYHASAASLYTFCYGWWGFPFGIYWTMVALIKNLKGSTSVRIDELLRPAPAKPHGFNERFQNNFSRRLRAGFFIDDEPAGILPAETAVK